MKPLRVLFVTSELNPLAKVGGLGDVAGALPRALKDAHVDVRVALPKYDIVNTQKFSSRLLKKNIPVSRCDADEKINILKTVIPGSRVPVYLLDNKKYLGNGGVYCEKTAFVGSFKEIERFMFFCLATLELFPALDWWPGIIHCQDWHTGIIPTLLREKGKTDPRYKKIKTLFTIHNAANQGVWSGQPILDFLCLERERINGLTKGAQNINLMGQGIRDATAVNTVSNTYAKEITTKEYGEGLESLLRKRGRRLYGVVNGVDQEFFNPETDPAIAKRYNTRTVIRGKQENKRDLQKTMRLPREDVPVCGLVSRLTNQKGIDLVAKVLGDIARRGAQCVLLGTGEPALEKQLRRAAAKYPKNIAAVIAFDAALANKIYAGSDVFLMPSRFEPCGLGQMISMRYGTLPIVRRTGGLRDTVQAYSGKGAQDKGWGFVFTDYSVPAFRRTVMHALHTYEDTATWRHLTHNAMKFDSSWKRAAREYLALYEKIVY